MSVGFDQMLKSFQIIHPFFGFFTPSLFERLYICFYVHPAQQLQDHSLSSKSEVAQGASRLACAQNRDIRAKTHSVGLCKEALRCDANDVDRPGSLPGGICRLPGHLRCSRAAFQELHGPCTGDALFNRSFDFPAQPSVYQGSWTLPIIPRMVCPLSPQFCLNLRPRSGRMAVSSVSEATRMASATCRTPWGLSWPPPLDSTILVLPLGPLGPTASKMPVYLNGYHIQIYACMYVCIQCMFM